MNSKYGPPANNTVLLELHIPDFEKAKSFMGNSDLLSIGKENRKDIKDIW